MRSFKVKNTSSETAPPGCVLEFTGTVDADGTISVQKPTLNNSMRFLINGFAAIPGVSGGVYSVGEAFPPTPQFVAGTVDADALTPLTAIGTKSGDWFLRSGQTGFFCVGPVSHGYINVIPEPGTTGSTTTTGPIYARITGRSGGKYSFVQVTRNSSGTYVDVSGGITGSTSVGYAQDIGGLANDILFTPTNLPFLLTPNPSAVGTWLFGPASICS